VDSLLINFFASQTVIGLCGVPQRALNSDYRAMQIWSLSRVTRPGEPAANEALPEQAARRQVWITRLGSYTRVILLAEEAGAEAAPSISAQSWA